MSTVYEKAMAGAYQNPDPYPSKPKKPEILTKIAGRLRRDELDALGKTKDDYERAISAFNAAKIAWREKDQQMGATFEEELAAEFDMLDHPKRALLFSKAWDQGHSAGYSEVALIYEDLLELVK